MGGIEDKRSPLAKALGERVPCKVITVEKGRLVGVPLALLALSADESQEATIAAHKQLVSERAWEAENLFTEGGTASLNLETAVQFLARALVVPPGKEVVDPAEVQRVAASPDDLRKHLQADEVSLLWSMYLEHVQERSPLSRAASWEEVEETLEALGKGQVSTFVLSGFDAVTLRFITHELARRLYTPTSSPSSDTSPSSESPPASPGSSDSTTDPTLTVE